MTRLALSGSHAVNEMHHFVDAEVDYPNDQSRYDGSNHNDDSAVGQFTLSWPRNLMNEFVIRFLDIRKPVIKKLLHLFICLSLFAREVRLELTTYGFGDRRSTN